MTAISHSVIGKSQLLIYTPSNITVLKPIKSIYFDSVTKIVVSYSAPDCHKSQFTI